MLKAHWTPRYLRDRTIQAVYFRLHPNAPWIAPRGVRILDGLVSSHSMVFEFGSGRSTLWLARRARHVVSVEHDPVWFDRVKMLLTSASVANVDLHLVSPLAIADAELYVEPLHSQPGSSIDVLIIDGIHRAECAEAALGYVRGGGTLMVDDAQRYLPSRSQCPGAVPHQSLPRGTQWQRVWTELASWSSEWAYSGVSDTVFFRKPDA